jgi:hypothetical protein
MHGDKWFWVEENEFGKQTEGSREQPRWETAVKVGCTQATIAVLSTVTLQVAKGIKKKLMFLIDTGAQLRLCKYDSSSNLPTWVHSRWPPGAKLIS